MKTVPLMWKIFSFKAKLHNLIIISYHNKLAAVIINDQGWWEK